MKLFSIKKVIFEKLVWEYFLELVILIYIVNNEIGKYGT